MRGHNQVDPVYFPLTHLLSTCPNSVLGKKTESRGKGLFPSFQTFPFYSLENQGSKLCRCCSLWDKRRYYYPTWWINHNKSKTQNKMSISKRPVSKFEKWGLANCSLMSNQDPVEIIIPASDRGSQRSGFDVAIVWFPNFTEQVLKTAWLFVMFKEFKTKYDVEWFPALLFWWEHCNLSVNDTYLRSLLCQSWSLCLQVWNAKMLYYIKLPTCIFSDYKEEFKVSRNSPERLGD